MSSIAAIGVSKPRKTGAVGISRTGIQTVTGIVQDNLIAWMDATDSNTITQSAGKVSAWSSKVGSITFTQTAEANKPSTGTETIGGLNVLRFPIATGAMNAGGLNVAASNTVLMVVNMYDLTLATPAIYDVKGTTSFSMVCGTVGVDGHPRFRNVGLGWGLNIIVASQNIHNNVIVLGSRMDAVNNKAEILVDGVVKDSTGTYTTDHNTNGNCTLGRSGVGDSVGIDVGEFLVYNTNLSSDELAQTTNSLLAKWSIT